MLEKKSLKQAPKYVFHLVRWWRRKRDISTTFTDSIPGTTFICDLKIIYDNMLSRFNNPILLKRERV